MNLGLSHTGCNGSDPFERMSDAGYTGVYEGEVTLVRKPPASAQTAFDMFKGSPGHWALLTSSSFTQIGDRRERVPLDRRPRVAAPSQPACLPRKRRNLREIDLYSPQCACLAREGRYRRGLRCGSVAQASEGRLRGRRRNAAFGALAAVATLIVFPALAGADATNPPVVTTDPATGVTNTSATLNGTIDPNDPDNGASYTFSWGQTTAYGNDVSGTTSPGTTPQSVSKALTGLAPRNDVPLQAVRDQRARAARRHDVRRRSVLRHARCADGRRRATRPASRTSGATLRRDGQPERCHGQPRPSSGTGPAVLAPAWTNRLLCGRRHRRAPAPGGLR